MTRPEQWRLTVGAPFPVFHVKGRPGWLRRTIVRLLLGWRWEPMR